ncbi:MFS family permease [Paenarthrobacter nicotinovorans]|uniref:MFS transporter n=1 Tax=Paenarthrobacter nicotinovorans TaxID=29320 RepID=A0ABV0GXQ6_PAENI|nr:MULTISPECIES: MFS transporter [Micrococcaceae]MDR6436597.1 MFS family permease [Paenarthrobacter nicotinovorans]SCZ57195.1 Predicted arabinose efflux permease, MFS family [Arthrobacter sp. UNCCL28]
MSVKTSGRMKTVLFSSFMGTAIEFYDFLLYGLAASLVFAPLYFANMSPALGIVASFATLAVGYLARPLGGLIFGHFGDRLGRKRMLVLTMLMMGGASFCIGLLPTQAMIGQWAPLLLILLRIIQGIAVGGEWGGAALMAMEHSTPERRGFSASFANMGGPAGAALATVAFTLSSLLPEESFMSWGWRLPFLFSAVLVGVGLFVRLKVAESPVFLESQRQAASSQLRRVHPLLQVLRKYPRAVVVACLGTIMAFAVQSLLATFAMPYAVAAGHSRSDVLWISLATQVIHVFTIPMFAALSDRIGRRKVMITGVVGMIVLIHPLWLMIGADNLALLFLAFLIGNPLLQAMVYGPTAAFISEMFGAESRYTGASLAYQVSATLGGGLVPLAATALLAARGGNDPIYVSALIVAIGIISLIALLVPQRPAKEVAAEDAGAAVSVF